jgi:hypothetical protein
LLEDRDGSLVALESQNEAQTFIDGSGAAPTGSCRRATTWGWGGHRVAGDPMATGIVQTLKKVRAGQILTVTELVR